MRNTFDGPEAVTAVARADENGPAYVAITDASLLGLVSELIGDTYASLSAIELSGTRLSIPVLFHEWGRSKSTRTRLAVLRINDARAFTVDDKAHIDTYQLMDVQFDPSTTRLIIRGAPDLSISVEVGAVDVEVEVFAVEGPSAPEFKLIFGLKASGAPDVSGVDWIR